MNTATTSEEFSVWLNVNDPELVVMVAASSMSVTVTFTGRSAAPSSSAARTVTS